MMQVPLLSYPQFSQFLQLQQQQQFQYSRGFLPTMRSGTSSSSGGSPSPSPSPPLDSYTASKTMPAKAAKSFTIDAILGIRESDMEPRFAGGKARVDIGRMSAMQLPTDLSVHTGVHHPHHPPGAFPNPCSRLSEKSPTDSSKKCGGKSKRVRTIFTPEQLERLEAEFERQQYMVGPERLYLAHTLQLTEAQVKVWFQNRRIKWRKQHLEIQQQRLAAIKQQQQQQRQEDDSDESVDSGGYPYSVEPGDPTPVAAHFKPMDATSDPDTHFQTAQNNTDCIKNESDVS